jgi:sugar O-acyltransferase (sialic acid O-acetyltransferase NeuD family)
MIQPSSTALSLVLLGAGGHAKVVLSLAQAAGFRVVGVCDPGLAQQGAAQWRGIPVLGDDDALDTMSPADTALANGIGQLVAASARRNAFVRLRQRGFRFPCLVHPRAWVDATASLSEGVQVMAGAIVQADCSVEANTILNTGASIDHDCIVGAHVHIAPGVRLCGAVAVGDRAFVGAGATVLPSLTLGADAIVAAGSTLARNLQAAERYAPHAGQRPSFGANSQ